MLPVRAARVVAYAVAALLGALFAMASANPPFHDLSLPGIVMGGALAVALGYSAWLS